MGTKSQKKTSVPRSQIIDRELLKYKGKDPDFDAIATAVIKAKAAPEGKRASVISQAKVRHNWYTKDGKKNPAAEKQSSGQKPTTKTQPQPSK